MILIYNTFIFLYHLLHDSLYDYFSMWSFNSAHQKYNFNKIRSFWLCKLRNIVPKNFLPTKIFPLKVCNFVLPWKLTIFALYQWLHFYQNRMAPWLLRWFLEHRLEVFSLHNFITFPRIQLFWTIKCRASPFCFRQDIFNTQLDDKIFLFIVEPHTHGKIFFLSLYSFFCWHVGHESYLEIFSVATNSSVSSW